ncbi:translation initiation factor IF3 [Purpureocillium lavendulum]|uniref:Translation initiation factor IF3 n=1 Tax=Purpureocillium lavendulum TaxID=1247861 RepID=A0AB34FI80_9HYPO|nr:translation initiation factor IF3 [Purpureocillium lavendulum]
MRTYGMFIRYNTAAGGTIDWDGDCIKHRKIKFTMGTLSHILHILTGEARGLLAELTAVDEEGVEALPPIEWSRLEDDHSEGRGKDWVLRRILESKARRKSWFTGETADGDKDGDDNPYKASAVRKYARTFEQFRERLWMLMHMVAGQPARSTEILGIRFINTINGGVRNIMAHNRMMCFVTSYHKGYRYKAEGKIIYRYLLREIGELLEGDYGDEDDDDTGDNPADMQAGHGTHVAGMIYARELQQGPAGTAAQREKFRRVSRQWHQLLEFGAEDWGGAGRNGAGAKRRRCPFDADRETARFQRFARLNRVDIRGELRNMMGDSTEFRGQQESVIRAIIRGEGPILQVAGTGGGKSLSFMLPAYCSSEGTTIVIVPLTALREDMHGRCEKNKIDSYVWQSGGSHPVTTIIFVTPESAVTKGFRDFVNRL